MVRAGGAGEQGRDCAVPPAAVWGWGWSEVALRALASLAGPRVRWAWGPPSPTRDRFPGAQSEQGSPGCLNLSPPQAQRGVSPCRTVSLIPEVTDPLWWAPSSFRIFAPHVTTGKKMPRQCAPDGMSGGQAVGKVTALCVLVRGCARGLLRDRRAGPRGRDRDRRAGALELPCVHVGASGGDARGPPKQRLPCVTELGRARQPSLRGRRSPAGPGTCQAARGGAEAARGVELAL